MTSAVVVAKPAALEKLEPQGRLVELGLQAQSLIPKAKAFKVVDDTTKAKALAIIKQIKERSKTVSDLKDELIKPQKKALDEATKKFTGPIKDFKAAEDALKAAIIAYDQEQWRLKQQKALEVAKAVERGDSEAAHAALVLASDVPEKIEGVSNTKRWTVEIVDKAAVPDQYKVVDEKALLEVARATNGNAAVPGVRFVQVAGLSVRA